MKKILAMALALLFVAALFTGCSKKVESPSEPNANDVASDTTEEVKERTSADNTDADSRTVKIGFAIKSTGSCNRCSECLQGERLGMHGS